MHSMWVVVCSTGLNLLGRIQISNNYHPLKANMDEPAGILEKHPFCSPSMLNYC